MQTFAFLLRPGEEWQKSKGKPAVLLIYKTPFYFFQRPWQRMRKGAQKSDGAGKTVQKTGTTAEEIKEKQQEG